MKEVKKEHMREVGGGHMGEVGGIKEWVKYCSYIFVKIINK